MPSSKLVPLVLSEEERRVLVGWTRRRTTAQGLAMRARIVLACAEGGSNTDVAGRLRLNRSTVATWRARFVRDRLDGLSDEPRPGRPRTITDDQVEHVVVTTLETKPVNATHWSTRSLAAQTGMTQSAVSRIWRAFGLKPHKVDTFKISKDPLFVDKVRDVVGLYLDPPGKAVVLCVDEKSQIQALDRSAPVLPMLPGVPERQSFDYVRHGTTSLFAALEIATGQVISAVKRRHRHQEFLAFLRTIDKTVPTELDVHVILDNLSTHKTPAVKTWLLKHPRFHLHFTPTGSSWLNLVERFFAEITVKLLRRGVHRSVTALEKDIRTWIKQWNTNPKPYVWTRTADQILESLAAYCQRINDSGH
ncbi:IS630 family transposase [Amycolatopsis sp. YIM 10]|uniref:IS630 family transposase n=1 Tax=Amycolatopsis sp. YIM 10 TaxID=2653857 RepID=UPI001290024F|nr:IS630 family transposase [Amycolatopsis sp. YIM 10]QFU90214.1 Integrase core domain protein [Amycolatopsis sp. YIM 10]